LDRIRKAMEEFGIPPRDLCEVPSSDARFPDGGRYRIEIAGVERASAMETMVREAERLGVVVHRVITTVGGATMLTKAELKDLAEICAANRIEAIVTPGPRRFWDTGRQITTSEGLVSGMRIRGSENLYYWLKDVERSINAGFRGFLVADEGILRLVNHFRTKGVFPSDVIFKVSVFAGHANAAGACLLEELGANSFNPVADLTVEMLAAIRKAIKIPMDVYVCLVAAMGGFNRFYEAAEIARVCSPCYFKFEPGPSEDEIYAPWRTEAEHSHLVREKVRYAAIVEELIKDLAPDIEASPGGSPDLAVPQP